MNKLGTGWAEEKRRLRRRCKVKRLKIIDDILCGLKLGRKALKDELDQENLESQAIEENNGDINLNN